jgi:uncharacterized membrane-anchored protein
MCDRRWMKAWWVIGCLVVAMAMSGVALADKAKPPAEKVTAGKPKAGDAGKAPAPDAKAAPQADPPAEAEADEADRAAEASLANLPRIVGPKRVDLGHQAEIDLPAGMILFERTEAQEMMRKGGNGAEHVVAAIAPASDATWYVVIEASDVGYVSDDDASELDASGMLEQFKRGNIEQNKRRAGLGISELVLDGWSEPPRYESATRHLVWGLSAHSSDGKVVNFFTRVLGRNGYLSINLIDDPSTLEASKVQALSILTAVHFTSGARYEDHVDSDRDSGLGLKALVLGGAGVVVAKKTGILIAIVLALKKGFIVVFAAIGGFFRWLFGRKKRESDDLVPSDPLPPSDPDVPPLG